MVLEDFQWENEWVDKNADKVHEGEDFTWAQVDEASDASAGIPHNLRSRKRARRAQGDGGGGPIVYSSRRQRNVVANSDQLDEEDEEEDEALLEDLDDDDDVDSESSESIRGAGDEEGGGDGQMGSLHWMMTLTGMTDLRRLECLMM